MPGTLTGAWGFGELAAVIGVSTAGVVLSAIGDGGCFFEGFAEGGGEFFLEDGGHFWVVGEEGGEALDEGAGGLGRGVIEEGLHGLGSGGEVGLQGGGEGFQSAFFAGAAWDGGIQDGLRSLAQARGHRTGFVE